MKKQQKLLDEFKKNGYLYIKEPFFNFQSLKKVLIYALSEKLISLIIRETKNGLYFLEINLDTTDSVTNLTQLDSLIKNFELKTLKFVKYRNEETKEFEFYSDSIDKRYLYKKWFLCFTSKLDTITFTEYLLRNKQLYFLTIKEQNYE